MTNATLIKIDRNGSKHYEGLIQCDRCGGRGYYAIAIHNMQPVLSPHDGGVCWKCSGAGKVRSKWIERTPEYQAKLDAKREARREAKQAEWEAERAKREEEERREREERERREAERKAISQHIGAIGDKITLDLIYIGSASWEQPAFSGYGMETHYIRKFEDENGNVFAWKTTAHLGWTDEKGYWNHPAEGDKIKVSGRIKEHSVYNGQRQTMLTRCKVKPV